MKQCFKKMLKKNVKKNKTEAVLQFPLLVLSEISQEDSSPERIAENMIGRILFSNISSTTPPLCVLSIPLDCHHCNFIISVNLNNLLEPW
jgi:hypothetical protein